MGLSKEFGSLRRILGVPSLRWYWSNSMLSAFGDNLASIALLLIIIRETGSVASMALMSIVVAIPAIVFGVLSGVLVDRWDARRTVAISQCIRAVLVLGLVYVDLGGSLHLAYVLAFLQSLVGTFDDPARARVVRAITDNDSRLAVNSLTASGSNIAGVLGTSVAGLLIGIFDAYWPAFVINAIAFILGGLAFSRIHGSFDPPAKLAEISDPGESFAMQVRAGFTVTRQTPVLSAVVISACATTLGLGATNILLLPLVNSELELSVAWFGAIEAAQTSAMILASLAVAVLAPRLNSQRLVTVAIVGAGLGIIGLSRINTLPGLLLVMFFIGVTIAPMGSGYSTILQSACPGHLLGRVAATMNTLVQAASLSAMAVAGLFAETIGIRPTMALAGILCCLASVVAWNLFRQAEPLQA